ncbi:hypothetical protein TNCV_1004191 [Trichonephila clavipes]|nr:hypothetical protein TNCV_1004191 [Trichonephila clavipes]
MTTENPRIHEMLSVFYTTVKWYWARTCDKASHSQIPIPLGYRGLNEEAERTERPIRRLSKVMYGNTCADMQVDVMGECLSSIKHVVGEQLSGGPVVVVHEKPHPQMTGTLSYRPEETGGRQREKSLDTRHRRIDDRYRVLPWPEDCTVVVCLHDALYGVYL